MYPKNACGLLTLLVLGVGIGSGGITHAQEEEPNVTEQPAIGGNQTVSITLPTQTAGVNANYYAFHVDGDNYTWTLTNVTYQPGSTRNGRTNALGGSPLTLSVTTAGLAVTGPNPTTQYIDFAPCVGPVNEFCNWTGALRYRFKIDPTLTASPATTITTDGSSARTIQLVWPNALAGAAISAGCTVDSGVTPAPTITVSPASATANSSGQANFTITTAGLRRIASSGAAPSGRCTFKAHASSTNAAVVEVLGQRIAPTLDVSPSSDAAPPQGTTTTDRVVTVGTRTPVASGVTVDATCSVEGTTATVSLDNSAAGTSQSGSKVTDANGEVQFRVKSEKLVSLPPTGAPHVRCAFKVRELSSTYEYFAAGKQIAPSVSLSLGQITQTGTTSLTATMSPSYPGFTIVPSCTVNQYLPAVTATPTSASTNASGQQTFDITTPALVITDPNTNAMPSASCTFRAGGTGTAGLLQFRTGNTCVMTLSPPPPACGNPAQ